MTQPPPMIEARCRGRSERPLWTGGAGMNEPLHPLTLAEILDRTAQLYRSRFLVFMGIGAIPAGTVFVFAAGVFAFFTWMGSNARHGTAIADVLVWAFLITSAGTRNSSLPGRQRPGRRCHERCRRARLPRRKNHHPQRLQSNLEARLALCRPVHLAGTGGRRRAYRSFPDGHGRDGCRQGEWRSFKRQQPALRRPALSAPSRS